MIKNPLTIWLKQKLNHFRLKRQYEGLVIKEHVHISNSELSAFNLFAVNSRLSSSSIGRYSYLGRNTRVKDADIGSFCSIGPDVIIGPGSHPTHFVSTHPIFYSIRPRSGRPFVKDNLFEEFTRVKIGHDVWIGAGAIITDGVKIGNGAIIAANAVVVKDIPPYAIMGGVPAKLIKYRFSEDQIAQLNNSQWWTKSEDWMREHGSAFFDIDTFLKTINA